LVDPSCAAVDEILMRLERVRPRPPSFWSCSVPRSGSTGNLTRTSAFGLAGWLQNLGRVYFEKGTWHLVRVPANE